MDSILTSIKKLLGITEEYTHFDADIIIHINTALMVLNQLGVGPKEGFSISNSSAIWTDFIGDTTNLESVKTYIYLKVKLVFDPPLSSTVKDAMQRSLDELEWRLNVNAESVDSGTSDSTPVFREVDYSDYDLS